MPTTRVELSATAWTQVVASSVTKFTAQPQTAMGTPGSLAGTVAFRFEASAPDNAETFGLRLNNDQALTRDSANGALYARGTGHVVVAQ